MKKNKIILGAIMIIVALVFTQCKCKCKGDSDNSVAGRTASAMSWDSIIWHDAQTYSDKAFTNNFYVVDAVVNNSNNLPNRYKVSISFDNVTFTPITLDGSANFIQSPHNGGVPPSSWSYTLYVKIENKFGTPNTNVYTLPDAYYYNSSTDNNCAYHSIPPGLPTPKNYIRRVEIIPILNEGPESYRTNCSMVPDDKDLEKNK